MWMNLRMRVLCVLWGMLGLILLLPILLIPIVTKYHKYDFERGRENKDMSMPIVTFYYIMQMQNMELFFPPIWKVTMSIIPP